MGIINHDYYVSNFGVNIPNTYINLFQVKITKKIIDGYNVMAYFNTYYNRETRDNSQPLENFEIEFDTTEENLSIVYLLAYQKLKKIYTNYTDA